MHVSLCPDGARTTGTRWVARLHRTGSGGRLLRLDVPFLEDPRPHLTPELRKLGLEVLEWTHHPLTGAWSGTATRVALALAETA